MDKSNLELFKQAISEGLSEKFDSVVDSCTEKIVCSEKHNIAMRTIVCGKVGTKRTWSTKIKQIIAILVAVALLLTSCGIIFRNEICEIFEEFFTSITFPENESNTDTITEAYKLTYVPEGYTLDKENISPLSVVYKYVDENDNFIWFEQRILKDTDFVIDSESGYSKIMEIEKYDVYYRKNSEQNVYVWTDGKYSLWLNANLKLSYEEIVQIIDGILK